MWTINHDSATLAAASPARSPRVLPCAELAATSTMPTATRLATLAARSRVSEVARVGSSRAT